MKMRAMVTQVRENHSVTKGGAPVTYRDVHLADASTDPLTRYSGEVVYRPNDSEFSALPLKRGDLVDCSVLQILELRNGNPVARVELKQVTPAAK